MKSFITLTILSTFVVASNDFYIKTEGVNISINGNEGKVHAVQRYSGNSSETLRPYVGIFLSNDTICSLEDDEFLGDSSSTLKSSDLSDGEDITVQLPNKAKKGVWYICAIADYKNQYPETSETNNASYREIEDGKEYGPEQHVPDVRYFLSYDEKRDFFSIRYFTRKIEEKHQIKMEYSYDKNNWKDLDINSNSGTYTKKIEGSLTHNKIYVQVKFSGKDPYLNNTYSHWHHVKELSYSPNPSLSSDVEGSIYDGTGSLISSQNKCWGCDRDEATMQSHYNKNSTVTFQWLKNTVSCDHIDIHSNVDLKQDVYINVKGWSDDTVQNSYKVKLPVGSAQTKKGISIEANNQWTTLAITTTKPIKEKVSIYAYCRSSIDVLNKSGIEEVTAQMTELDNGHKHLGNGSLISTAGDNGQNGIGLTMDVGITSNSDDAETSFQIRSSKGTCEEVMLQDSDGNSDIEEVLIKEWAEKSWKQTDCISLPCTLKTYFSKDDKPAYTLINVKTKAGHNNQIYATCGKKEIKFNMDEKGLAYKHPNGCKFTDLSSTNPNYQYVTALCSAQIIQGYDNTGYTKYKPEGSTLWQELTKVVNLSENFYKVKKLQESYSSGNWFDVYIDLAKKQGFDKNPSSQVKRGNAFKYIVSVFWKKNNLSEIEAGNFLKNRGVISELDTSKYLRRGDMARIVLYSSRLSADESNIERKLSYVDYKDENINNTRIIPEDIYETPKSKDKDSVKNQIIDKNIDSAKRKESILSSKGKTNNDALSIAIAGGKSALQPEYQDKSGEQIIEVAKKKGVNKNVGGGTKVESHSMVGIKDSNTGKTVLAQTSTNKDSKGNAKIILENKHGEVSEVTREELEKNDKRVTSQFRNIDILKKK